MNNNVLFISREINLLNFSWPDIRDLGWNIYGASLIKFSPKAFNLPTPFEWIYFSSKNGVKYFYNQLNPIELTYLKDKKIATIGKSTAKQLILFNQIADLTFDGNPETATVYFNKNMEGGKILFPRANNSNRTTQSNLSPKVESIDLVVYDNTIRKLDQLKYSNLALLTSPLNVIGFFDQYKFAHPKVIFVPGESTAKKVAELTDSEIVVLPSYEEGAWSHEILNYISEIP